jgi:hypothetical protein
MVVQKGHSICRIFKYRQTYRVFIMSRSAKEWSSPQNALAYLNVADNLPHRSDGESVLIDHLPENTKRVLDLAHKG